MSANNSSRVLTGIGWAYGERVLAQLISLIVSIILARLLDPEHYGIIALVTVIINILDALASGGFGNALVQKDGATDRDFNSICWLSVLISIVLYIATYFAAPYVAKFYGMEELNAVIKVMGIRVIISAFNSVQHAYVQKHMQFKKFFYSTLGGTLVSAIVGIIMAYEGFGVWALVAQYMTNSIIDTVVLYFTIEWKPKFELYKESVCALSGFGLKMTGATLVNTLQDNVRSLVVGKVFTTADLAYYNQGKKYPSTLMNSLIGSIQKVLFPAFSEQQDDKKIICNMMRKSIRISSFVLVPAVAGIIAVADNLILLLLTEKWLECVPYLRILSLIYILRPLNTILQSGLLAIGKSSVNLFHEVVSSILSLVLIAISAFVLKSVHFMAWSYIITLIVGTLIFVIFTNKNFNYTITQMIYDYCPALLLSSIMACCVYFVGKLPINTLLLLLIQILTGVVVYFALAKIFKLTEFNIMISYIKKVKLKIKPRN